eukprot:CAMPEP_0197880944 /NCGR_PEP_ID=MMETSP1439-20131203/8594_1 /TAXON_ID=66791 /ORGANISM="Gonyaulax spinifera, Strain CCMP409" /LENGTH=80 /DNA_ID=CAMNT_0043500521 /DNA_START=38 /DNA_END=277 /DNA_ORIENTATION=+
MACVSVRNDRVEVVYHRRLGALLRCHSAPVLVLLPVMEKLSLEQLIDFVRHCVIGVVSHVGAWLVGRAGRGAGLPAAHVD